jgi:hypothetical protein
MKKDLLITKNRKQPVKRIIRYINSITTPKPKPGNKEAAKREFLYDFKKEHLW